MILNIEFDIDEEYLKQFQFDICEIKRAVSYKSNYYEKTLWKLFNATIAVVENIKLKKE